MLHTTPTLTFRNNQGFKTVAQEIGTTMVTKTILARSIIANPPLRHIPAWQMGLWWRCLPVTITFRENTAQAMYFHVLTKAETNTN